MGGGAVQGGRVGRLLVGAVPRVWGSRAGGEDSIQGHAEAIRWRQHSREGRRPWGRRWRRPCLARHGGEDSRVKGDKV
jgi:hypothetical protein